MRPSRLLLVRLMVRVKAKVRVRDGGRVKFMVRVRIRESIGGEMVTQ